METLVAKNQLGQLLHERGQTDEALVLLREALDGRLESLGSRHPQVFNARRALSRLLNDIGQVDEAQRVLRPEDVEELEKSLGGEHRVSRGAAETLEEINQAFDELKIEGRRLEEKLEEEKRRLAEEERHCLNEEKRLNEDRRRLEERVEQLQAEKERLLYDVQRRGRPLNDDRNAIRRGLLASSGQPGEPYQPYPGDTSPGSTSSSEAGGPAPLGEPPPSLPPGAPSSTSSGSMARGMQPTAGDEADRLPDRGSIDQQHAPMAEMGALVAAAAGLGSGALSTRHLGTFEAPCQGALQLGKRQCPGANGNSCISGVALSAPAPSSVPEASPGHQELVTQALASDGQALANILADEEAFTELQVILSQAKRGILGSPANISCQRSAESEFSPPAHSESVITPKQALDSARHHLQTARTAVEAHRVLRTLAMALGAVRTEAGTIKALHAVLLQLRQPELKNVEVCKWTGASMGNFAKWRRRVLSVGEVNVAELTRWR